MKSKEHGKINSVVEKILQVARTATHWGFRLYVWTITVLVTCLLVLELYHGIFPVNHKVTLPNGMYLQPMERPDANEIALYNKEGQRVVEPHVDDIMFSPDATYGQRWANREIHYFFYKENADKALEFESHENLQKFLDTLQLPRSDYKKAKSYWNLLEMTPEEIKKSVVYPKSRKRSLQHH